MNNELPAQSQFANPSAKASQLTPEQKHLRRLKLAVESNHEVLYARVRTLARQMTKLAADLEEFGLEAVVNRLGEVQGQGVSVDLSCATFVAAREALSHFKDDVIDA
ncbi:hypothetical protein LZC95_19715 [Pendulispora brunnea]|uniref:Uncharacterized protein n=1 Tax=Pendulispora brunnea TaxID=2905690 RepID=A0ABZ2KRT4_9BACT